MKKLLLLCGLIAGCVDGRELIAPEDPRFSALCVDSAYTDSTKVCWAPETAEVVVVVPNPNPTSR